MRIELKNILFSYQLDTGNPVLSGISCTINQRELIGIIGKTGSGKTTFLQLCAGILFPQSGEVCIDGIPARKEKDWNKFRRNIGIVFQFPEKQLFEETVFADVAFGISQITKDPDEVKLRVYGALEEVGLAPDVFANRSPHQLSSGEQRKTALAGIIAMNPDMLFLDEPTIGLDYNGATEVETIIKKLHKREKTVCVVSHNIDFLVRVVTRILVISEKTILYDGPKEQLFYDSDRVKSLHIEKPEIVTVCEALGKQNNGIFENIFDVRELVTVLKRAANSSTTFVKNS